MQPGAENNDPRYFCLRVEGLELTGRAPEDSSRLQIPDELPGLLYGHVAFRESILPNLHAASCRWATVEGCPASGDAVNAHSIGLVLWEPTKNWSN